MTDVDTNAAGTHTTIDLDVRPETYWPEIADRTRWLASRVKGEARRRAALGALAAGGPVGLEPWMVEHDIGLEGKAALAWLDPGLRGGEDLPDLGAREVEIARIWFTRTVHREVTSVRARPSGDRIRYRVVDEYCRETGYAFAVAPKSSRRPLTLGQLVRLIDTAAIAGEEAAGGLVVRFWDGWAEQEEDAEAQRGSIEVSSDFYPRLGDWYEKVFERWLRDKTRNTVQVSKRGGVEDHAN